MLMKKYHSQSNQSFKFLKLYSISSLNVLKILIKINIKKCYTNFELVICRQHYCGSKRIIF